MYKTTYPSNLQIKRIVRTTNLARNRKYYKKCVTIANEPFYINSCNIQGLNVLRNYWIVWNTIMQ